MLGVNINNLVIIRFVRSPSTVNSQIFTKKRCIKYLHNWALKTKEAGGLLFVDVVPRLLPPLLAAGSVVFLGDAAQTPGPAVLLLHEAGVQVGFVVRPTDWLQRGRTDSATASPLEHREAAGERDLWQQYRMHYIFCYFRQSFPPRSAECRT